MALICISYTLSTVKGAESDRLKRKDKSFQAHYQRAMYYKLHFFFRNLSLYANRAAIELITDFSYFGYFLDSETKNLN